MNQDDDLDRLFRTALQRDTAGWQAPVSQRERRNTLVRARLLASMATVGLAALLVVGGLALHGRLAGGESPIGGGHPPVVGTSPSTLPATATPYAVTPSAVAVSPTAPGGPVPPGFVPVSGSGLPDGTIWLLGTAPCSSAPCTSIVRSLDGGRDWVGIPAPRTPLSGYRSATGVSQLLFANAEDGWAYGPELWSTHDGGASWHQVTVAGGGILSAAVAGDQLVVAIGAESDQGGTVLLAHAPVTGDDLTVTDKFFAGSATTFPPPVELAGSASGAVWALTSAAADGQLLSSVNGGASWTATTYPCTQGPIEADEAAIAAAAPGRLVVACGWGGAAGSESKTVKTSSDGGQSWSTVAAATEPSPTADGVLLGGDLDGIAADGSTMILSSSSGGSELETSADGGVTWSRTLGLASGGTPWSSVVFLDPQDVLAVTSAEPQVAAGSAYISTDAGQTWTELDIPG